MYKYKYIQKHLMSIIFIYRLISLQNIFETVIILLLVMFINFVAYAIN